MINKLFRKRLLEQITETGFMAYHGSTQSINKFVDDFVGGNEATDQEGPGIYFTTEYDDARGYGEYVYTVKLRGNFLISTGDPISLSRELIMNLAKMANDWESDAQNFAEDPEVGIENLVDSAFEYNNDEKGVLQQIWIELYRYEPIEFVRNCVSLGIDGIVVDRYNEGNNNGKHIIIYNPNAINFVEVEKDI